MKKLTLLALIMFSSISMANDCPPGERWSEESQACYPRPVGGVRG